MNKVKKTKKNTDSENLIVDKDREQIHEENLTESKEDYLRAIFILKHRHNKTPMLNEIAEYLGIKKTTVSEALKSLHDQGLVVKQNYKPIDLTHEGNRIAKKLTWKHRLIESFLFHLLGVPDDQVHNEAHKLEHSLSDEIAVKLYNFLNEYHQSIELFKKLKDNNAVLTCPHGQPIPRLDEI